MSEKQKKYLLVIILLFFSGNPLVNVTFTKFSPIIGLFLTISVVHKTLFFSKTFLSTLFKIFFTITAIGIAQYIQLSYVSVEGMINLLMKITMGAIIINYLKTEFIWIFFNVIFYFSAISLCFYVIINILHIPLPSFTIGFDNHSYIIYGTSFEIHMHKNAGMFWEPGAYSGVLTLCLVLNHQHLKQYWKKYKIKLLVVIITLLTTQSTTGYIVGFIIIVFYYLNTKNVLITLSILPILLMSGIYIYKQTDFLNAKIERQFTRSEKQDVGDFSNTRFGSLIFDWYYIAKHPLCGNGLSDKTRYADHTYLTQGKRGNIVGSGNGFSHYLACMGIFFIVGYFYLLWKSTSKQGKIFSFLVCLVVILNLQGEQWFNYPLYLGLPFIIFSTTVKKTKQNQLTTSSEYS